MTHFIDLELNIPNFGTLDQGCQKWDFTKKCLRSSRSEA